MDNLIIFQNAEFGQIRTVEIDGKPYFVGSDIAKSLGYAIPSKAVNTHCKGVSKMEVPSNGGKQEMLIIPEGDVYRLITHSKLPSAERFESWVFDEVLPSIRKNGGYLAGQETMSDEEIMAKALMVAQKTISNKNHIIEKQQKVIEELQPKASYYDLVLQCKDTIATTIIAKDYGMAPMKFNLMLKEFGIQFKQGETWLLYSKYQGYGYMATKTHNFPDLDGVQHTRIHSYWTQKGRLFLYDFLKEKGILPLIERQEIA